MSTNDPKTRNDLSESSKNPAPRDREKDKEKDGGGSDKGAQGTSSKGINPVQHSE
jgi:hypothetical protein